MCGKHITVLGKSIVIGPKMLLTQECHVLNSHDYGTIGFKARKYVNM